MREKDQVKKPWNFRRNGGCQTIFRSSVEYHPLPTSGYDKWFANWNTDGREKLGVVVPFFNEEAHELHRTLQSLYNQITHPQNIALRSFSMHILLVMDGWFKASKSMKSYIKEMFPHDTLWKTQYFTKKSNTITANFIVHNAEGNNVTAGNESGNFYITLLVKIDNRRKHNSHQWFFHAFDRAYRPKYMFATDCGTAFGTGCLEALTSYLEHHGYVSAVTGRQRIMSKELQGCKDGFFSLENYYRLVQTFDFESAISCYSGAFSLFGILPVIPGPCGLFRMSDIRGAPLDWYFKNVNQDPDTAGILLGNLLLAEDRLLSWAAALKTKETRFTILVPEAIFYFEAETELDKFVPQRRRWQNGTFAGYLFIIQDICTKRDLFMSPEHSLIRKLAQIPVLFFMICQVFQYLVMSFSPAIFLGTFFMGLETTFVDSDTNYTLNNCIQIEGRPPYQLKIPQGDLSGGVAQTFVFLIFGFFALFYAFFCIKHHTSKQAVRGWAFHFMGVINIFIVLFSILSIGQLVFNIFYSCSNWYEVTEAYLAFILVGAWFLPFLLAIFQGRTCIWLMIKSMLPYLMYLPTIVGGFQIYSVSRLYDLTWGNRPSEKLDSLINNDLDEGEETISPEELQRNRDATKNQLVNAAATVLALLIFLNAIILLAQINWGRNAEFTLWFLVVIFTPAVIQMFFSAFFFGTDPLRRIWKQSGIANCFCLCLTCPEAEPYDPTLLEEEYAAAPPALESEKTPILSHMPTLSRIDPQALEKRKKKEEERAMKNLQELDKLKEEEDNELLDYCLYDIGDEI